MVNFYIINTLRIKIMNTKNIFRTLFMVLLLLVGINNVKATEMTIWDEGTIEEYSIVEIKGSEFENASAGMKMRIYATIAVESNWGIIVQSGWSNTLEFTDWKGADNGKDINSSHFANIYNTIGGYFEMTLSANSVKILQQQGAAIHEWGVNFHKISIVDNDDNGENNGDSGNAGNGENNSNENGTVYVSADISDAGYATFCSTKSLDFSGITTLKAYYATAVSDTEVTFKQVTGTVAAGTGLLLVGTTSQVLVAEAGNECAGNLLVGVLGNDEIVNAANKYVLVVKDGEVKFADTAAQAATVPAGKAYLQAPSNSRILTFSFDGEATGISAVNTVESQKQAVYNLQGQRVTTMNKGLYIINGKKVMIK